jgi:hypothetical protein
VGGSVVPVGIGVSTVVGTAVGETDGGAVAGLIVGEEVVGLGVGDDVGPSAAGHTPRGGAPKLD